MPRARNLLVMLPDRLRDAMVRYADEFPLQPAFDSEGLNLYQLID